MVDVFDRLVDILETAKADFTVIEHEPEGRSEQISRIRGNDPSQAAKAMVVAVKAPVGLVFVLAVLPGDRRVDFGAIARSVGGKKAALAAPEEARRLTECEMGAVPPFALSDELTLVVDPRLLAHDRIAFNAGRLDRSMFLSTRSYVAVAQPKVAPISG